MRPSRPYTYLGTVTGMCRQCRALVPARVIAAEGAVHQERLCPKCGTARTRIADDVAWYLDRVAATVRCKPARLPAPRSARAVLAIAGHAHSTPTPVICPCSR